MFLSCARDNAHLTCTATVRAGAAMNWGFVRISFTNLARRLPSVSLQVVILPANALRYVLYQFKSEQLLTQASVNNTRGLRTRCRYPHLLLPVSAGCGLLHTEHRVNREGHIKVKHNLPLTSLVKVSY